VTDETLLPFVRTAKEHGIPDESVVGILRQNGWPERRIYRTLAEYYSATMGIAVPVRAGTAENARDAFLYLLNFIALGFWTVALWQIWDDLVRRWFPDPLTDTGTTLREDIAWQVAVLVVTFPLFALMHVLIQRELARRPELYYSPIRRWLTYLTLVFAAIAIVVDAAMTIQSLIVGHLTTHFLLDTLGLMLLGGGVFAYYLLTMDPPKQQT
jgi:hypothetical protein